MTPAGDAPDFRQVGAAAVKVNAPMGADRMRQLAGTIADSAPGHVVDLGCGAGAFLREVAVVASGASCLGVDQDPLVIQRARAATSAADLASRVRFEVADATRWADVADALICVGASHAWGGPGAMLAFLRARVAAGGMAVVGEGFWSSEPDDWCRETFGALPTGPELEGLAERHGWSVVAQDPSTMSEWDAFEEAWTSGVEAIGTPEATAFGRDRRDGYQRYRGVLGFAWLVLRATPPRPM